MNEQLRKQAVAAQERRQRINAALRRSRADEERALLRLQGDDIRVGPEAWTNAWRVEAEREQASTAEAARAREAAARSKLDAFAARDRARKGVAPTGSTRSAPASKRTDYAPVLRRLGLSEPSVARLSNTIHRAKVGDVVQLGCGSQITKTASGVRVTRSPDAVSRQRVRTANPMPFSRRG